MSSKGSSHWLCWKPRQKEVSDIEKQLCDKSNEKWCVVDAGLMICNVGMVLRSKVSSILAHAPIRFWRLSAHLLVPCNDLRCHQGRDLAG